MAEHGLERIVLQFSLSAQGRLRCVRLFTVEEPAELLPPELSLLLSLERDAGSTFARGQIRSLDHQISFSIQSTAALFELLRQFVAAPGNVISEAP